MQMMAKLFVKFCFHSYGTRRRIALVLRPSKTFISYSIISPPLKVGQFGGHHLIQLNSWHTHLELDRSAAIVSFCLRRRSAAGTQPTPTWRWDHVYRVQRGLLFLELRCPWRPGWRHWWSALRGRRRGSREWCKGRWLVRTVSPHNPLRVTSAGSTLPRRALHSPRRRKNGQSLQTARYR